MLRSEVDIVCSLAEATLGSGTSRSRGPSSATTTPPSAAGSPTSCPGCAAYDEKVDQPGGFVLPHPPRDSREFPTTGAHAGKAIFSVCPLEVLEVPEGRLLLQTLRSHDQFNTTIYGLDDRYRGIKGGRRVVFVHPDDIRHLGWAEGDLVDLVSEWDDGSERTAPGVPDRRLRPAGRVRGGLLPRDQPAGPAGLQGRGQQHADLEVGRRAARGAARRPGRRDRAGRRDVEHGHKRWTDPVQQS